MSSEARHGLPEQPDPTCPMIDKALGYLKDVQSAMRRWEKLDDADDLRNVLDEVDTLLVYREYPQDELERIRAHVIKIREWGESWKHRALELEGLVPQPVAESQP